MIRKTNGRGEGGWKSKSETATVEPDFESVNAEGNEGGGGRGEAGPKKIRLRSEGVLQAKRNRIQEKKQKQNKLDEETRSLPQPKSFHSRLYLTIQKKKWAGRGGGSEGG